MANPSSTPDVAAAPADGQTKAAPKPSTTILNFWVDAALLVTVVFIMWVSVIIQVVFPAPPAAAGWELWGFTYDQWRNTQFYALCLCALLAIEHVVLHWNWVCTVIATRILRIKRPDEGSQAVYGVGTLITIFVVFLASLVAALFFVKQGTP